MKEKLQKYALIAEITSAIAIVLSLIFVGLQIQQSAEETSLNTKSVRLEAYQELLTQIAALNIVLVENPELVELENRITEDREEITQQDKDRYLPYLRTVWRHGSLAYYQFNNGLIDEKTLNVALVPTLALLRSKTVKELWRTGGRPLFDSEFVEYIENRLSE